LEEEQMKVGHSVCFDMVRILQKLLVDEEGSLYQCKKTLDRNYPFFRQLIDMHSKLLNTAFPHEFMHLLH
jgi:hypothetical protein